MSGLSLTSHSRKYYYPIDAYCNSKLAQVYFSKHLNILLKAKDLKVQVHSVHPGIVNTDLFEHSTNTAIPWFKNLFYKVSSLPKSQKNYPLLCSSLCKFFFISSRRLRRAHEQLFMLLSRRSLKAKVELTSATAITREHTRKSKTLSRRRNASTSHAIC